MEFYAVITDRVGGKTVRHHCRTQKCVINHRNMQMTDSVYKQNNYRLAKLLYVPVVATGAN